MASLCKWPLLDFSFSIPLPSITIPFPDLSFSFPFTLYCPLDD